MMADPNVQQSMNEALNNPDFVNMLIESNPMLRNLPNARELITSPFMRSMMGNPQMMSQAMRMQRNINGGDSSFPAPGATNTTPEGAAAGGNSGGQGGDGQNQQNPFGNNPFMVPGLLDGRQGGDEQPPNMLNLLQQLQGLQAMGVNPFGQAPGQAAAGQTTPGATTGQDTARAGTQQNPTSLPSDNPFSALLTAPGAGSEANPFGLNPEMIAQLMGGLGGGAAAAPVDNRPPEERYADQLRQLNDMGFFDFDANISALRRSGGSVQGAVEHLLNPAPGS